MVRALLDANVLISAAIRPSGPPGQIVAALLTQSFDLIISPRIIEEVEIALALPKIRKYLNEPEEVRWLADIVALGDLVADAGRIAGVAGIRRTTQSSPPASKGAPIGSSRGMKISLSLGRLRASRSCRLVTSCTS